MFFCNVSAVSASYHAVSQLSPCLHLAPAIWCVCFVCVSVSLFLDVLTCMCALVMYFLASTDSHICTFFAFMLRFNSSLHAREDLEGFFFVQADDVSL